MTKRCDYCLSPKAISAIQPSFTHLTIGPSHCSYPVHLMRKSSMRTSCTTRYLRPRALPSNLRPKSPNPAPQSRSLNPLQQHQWNMLNLPACLVTHWILVTSVSHTGMSHKLRCSMTQIIMLQVKPDHKIMLNVPSLQILVGTSHLAKKATIFWKMSMLLNQHPK